MKIGILTFFRNPNYGAMLQAYALWKFLEGKGHEVEFIDYDFANARRPSFLRCLISKTVSGVRTKLSRYVRYEISRFTMDYPKSRLFRSVEDLTENCPKYDFVIVGSDQMWNPLWCADSALPLVMLDFLPSQTKRISYAVSFGVKEWSRPDRREMAGILLNKFTAVSVRERSGCEIVRMLSKREDAKCLIDPTMLHVADFYRKIAEMSEGEGGGNEEPYIFSYLLDEWDDNQCLGSALAHVSNLVGINEISTDKVPVKGLLGVLCCCLSIKAKIPLDDWLEKISKASFVFTNSFHGTVFAILFHRPFVSLLLQGKMSGMNERILSLLDFLELRDLAVCADDKCALNKALSVKIDWCDVDRRLSVKRDETYEFFGECLIDR